MCSGKSRVGRALADRLNARFIDTDELLVSQTGESIAETIRSRGEPAFRELEKKIVRDLKSVQGAVIATGGGTPLASENLETLLGLGSVVWLRVGPETVLRRVGDVTTRPMIDPKNPAASVRELLARRAPIYSRASITIEADSGSPEMLADQILARLKSKIQ